MSIDSVASMACKDYSYIEQIGNYNMKVFGKVVNAISDIMLQHSNEI